jgi:hypothetical protein
MMIEVIGIFRNKTIAKAFDCFLDAGEYRDMLDAHYPLKIVWREL